MVREHIEKPQIIERGKITYYVYKEKVVVRVSESQWVSYNQYDNWNRQGITEFRNKILNSKKHEYDSPVEQMSLAVQCGIKGASTARLNI